MFSIPPPPTADNACTMAYLPPPPPLPQTHSSVVKALAEDSSVFEYDSLYDKMQDDKRNSDPRLQKKDTKVSFLNTVSMEGNFRCVNSLPSLERVFSWFRCMP